MTPLAGAALCLTLNPSVDMSAHTGRGVPADKLCGEPAALLKPDACPGTFIACSRWCRWL